MDINQSVSTSTLEIRYTFTVASWVSGGRNSSSRASCASLAPCDAEHHFYVQAGRRATKLQAAWQYDARRLCASTRSALPFASCMVAFHKLGEIDGARVVLIQFHTGNPDLYPTLVFCSLANLAPKMQTSVTHLFHAKWRDRVK